MYQHILVPLKRNSSDEAVIEHAGFLARLTGGQVTLLHVVHSHSRDESAYLEEQARAYLEGWVKLLTGRGVSAAPRGIDLIIMATHGHSEVRHVFVGSVTEDVVRNGDLPVLLVRPVPD
jgi:universal stress protein A